MKAPLAEVLAAQNRNAESMVGEVCGYVLVAWFFCWVHVFGFSFEHLSCLCLVRLTCFL